MNIFKIFEEKIINYLNELCAEDKLTKNLEYNNVKCEIPKDESHGNLATNAAMVLAKQAKMKPIDIAKLLVVKLENDADIVKCHIAGPGFINININDVIWHNLLLSVIKQQNDYGSSNIGNNEKVNIEFVSANPTGPMHIGHARGAVFGDSLARLLSFVGYNVTKEFYINDAGNQIDILAKSLFLRYKEVCGNDIGKIPQGLYPGEYLIDVANDLKQKYNSDLLNKNEEEYLPILKEFAINAMLKLIKNDLAALGVEHDIFSSEKKLHEDDKVNKALEILQQQDLLYEGMLEVPKGKVVEDWEPRPQLLFKSTLFGDDVDRPIKKSDGSWTYFASDIAYHLDKFERGFNKMILLLGIDHGGYKKRLQSAVKGVSAQQAEVTVLFHNLVNLYKNGQVIKMSKRAGNFLTVNDLLEYVDKNIIRFEMLTRKNDAILDFDVEKVREQSKDNPVFYVQYAHARACSVIRNMHDIFNDLDKLDVNIENLKNLNDKNEIDLIKKIAKWPLIVESSANANEPHRIAFYLQELAAEFHSLWNKGKEDARLKFIIEDNKNITFARFVMLQCLIVTIANGLRIFNVEPLKEMK